MRPIAEGLFTDEQPIRLVGGRNRATGRIVFPCPDGADFEPYTLKREGTLWSFTIQRFRPKSPPYAGPESFRPYPLGYVALEGETMVEARIENIAVEDIKIGMVLELIQVPLNPEADEIVLTHAFQPKGYAA
jgi:uncharacterized OB-fold protein